MLQMMSGSAMCGGGSQDGTVRARVRVINGEAVVSWIHEGVIDPGHRYAIAIDGDVVAILPAGSTSTTIGGLSAGEHRVTVRAVRPEARRVPELHGVDYGSRAWITWTPSADASTRAYAVYQDSELVAVLDTITVHGLAGELPTSGTGTGRVTINGEWMSAETNEAFAVEITAEGLFRHNVSGSWSSPQEFIAGGTYDLAGGVLVTFEDPVAAYAVSDSWTFRVGPPTDWDSEELAEGTYSFEVAARDGAGNESAALTSFDVAIVLLPPPVQDLAASWDGSEVTVSWTLPTDANRDGVLIYSNESAIFGILRDAVDESGAWATLAASATSHTFTPVASGVYRFFVRTRDSNGRVSDSVEEITIDTSAVPTGVALNEPEALTVTPIAAGAFRLTWQYKVSGGTGLTGFRVYANASASSPSYVTPEATVAASVASPGIAEYSWESDPYGATQYFTVRATDGTHETVNAELVQGVPDATAPAFSGSIAGVPN